MNRTQESASSLDERSDLHTEVTLSRTLGLFTITMIGVGGMIGAGIFVLTGIAAGIAGPGLVLAFALNGLVTLLTAMAYAELGSAFPEAGGGYLWVKEGLGGSQGFLAGWMSWFAHVVAGSLYALGFGRFATELWLMTGLPTCGMSEQQFVHVMTLVLMTLIILAFTALNYRGASETGTVGNLVTMTKILILGLFVLFGVVAMIRAGQGLTKFTSDFLPKGFGAVIQAMGLTFIAFEGYEIIAQSGEEVVDPKRNVPRAIFLAVGIALVIYLSVSAVAIGATVAPAGLRVYEYLGQQKEVAIVQVAQQLFPWGIGGAVLVFSGLVSTMSALNATTYSSSRVSFAMGRDQNLPGLFSRIHPRRHTPYLAVVFSGGLMLLMAWSLPIEQVAAAADLMFLILFAQVNLAILRLRRKMPDLDRGFVEPGVPVIPILGLACNLFLAVYLFTYSPQAWLVASVWVLIGLVAYRLYFHRQEAMERPGGILIEEVLVSRDYSVLVPVANPLQAHVLGRIGAILARVHGGELLALHVERVPAQLKLSDGRLLLKESRSLFENVIAEAKIMEVPVHTIARLGRSVHEAVRSTAVENASNLILLGWPGHTGSAGLRFGSVIDPLVDDPPTDIAVVRPRARRVLRHILVPVIGGPNSRLAVRLAADMAQTEEAGPVQVTLLHVLPRGALDADRVRGHQILDEASNGLPLASVERRLAEGENVVDTILSQADGCDLLIVGGSEEPVFNNLLLGNVAVQIAERAEVTVMMVKRRSSRIHSLLRQTVLQPSTPRNSAVADKSALANLLRQFASGGRSDERSRRLAAEHEAGLLDPLERSGQGEPVAGG